MIGVVISTLIFSALHLSVIGAVARFWVVRMLRQLILAVSHAISCREWLARICGHGYLYSIAMPQLENQQPLLLGSYGDLHFLPARHDAYARGGCFVHHHGDGHQHHVGSTPPQQQQKKLPDL